MSATQSVGEFGRVVQDELKYHFSHARTRETFLKSGLGCLFGFGLLAAVFAYVNPVNYVFFGLAVGGFALFMLVEISGAVVGFLYEKGSMKAARGVGMFVMAISALIVGFGYLGLGGILIGGVVMGLLVSVLPQAFIPVMIIAYVVFSLAWAANGMSWVDGSDVSPPPVGLLQWIVRIIDYNG